MTSGNNILSRIMQSYPHLTRSEILVADYVIQNQSTIYNTTVSQLAEACNTSVATVTRFCHSIGCQSFSEFKYQLAQTTFSRKKRKPDTTPDLYDAISPEDSIDKKCQKLYNISHEALAQTLHQLEIEKIDEAVSLLCEANNVFCFGQGNSSIVAMDAWGRFASISTKFHWIPDSHLQAGTAAILQEQDVILYFSFSGATRELAEIARLNQSTKSKLILVTRFPDSPSAALADLLLICGANESPHQQGSIAAKISQLFIIDVLYNEFCARNVAETEEKRGLSLASTANMIIK